MNMRDISSIENLERKTMEQTTANILKVQVSNLAIKNTTIPVTIEQKETGYGVYMVFPRELEFRCSTVSADEQKTEASHNSVVDLDQLPEEERVEYLKKRYSVQEIAAGLRKIKYPASSVSYVRKAIKSGFVFTKGGTNLLRFTHWVNVSNFTSTGK